jgi:hypothetical protein
VCSLTADWSTSGKFWICTLHSVTQRGGSGSLIDPIKMYYMSTLRLIVDILKWKHVFFGSHQSSAWILTFWKSSTFYLTRYLIPLFQWSTTFFWHKNLLCPDQINSGDHIHNIRILNGRAYTWLCPRRKLSKGLQSLYPIPNNQWHQTKPTKQSTKQSTKNISSSCPRYRPGHKLDRSHVIMGYLFHCVSYAVCIAIHTTGHSSPPHHPTIGIYPCS